MNKSLLFALGLVGAAGADEGKKVCRALAMSGGGTRGAFEAGALYGIYQALENKEDMAYDVVTGVSAGALNAGFIALTEPGNEEFMVNKLSEKWQSMSTSQLY